MLQDFRFALRQVRRTPAFAVVAVLTLALGIGANTAVFSVMNAVMLRYLPVHNADRLVFLHSSGQPSNTSQTGHDNTSLPQPAFEQLRAEHGIFSDLMAYVPLSTNQTAVRFGPEPEQALAEMVSGNFFSGLGVEMARGRGFTLEDEKQHANIAVLSDGYWARRFGRDPALLGSTMYIKGQPFTIVGVAAPDFIGVEHNTATDLWVPFQNRPELNPWGTSPRGGSSFYNDPNWWFLMMVGRLAPGVTEQRAQAMGNPVFQRAAYSALGTRDPKEKPPNLTFSSARGIQGLRDDYQQPLTLLMMMVGVVLVIACGNVSLLLLARNSTRVREFSLRLALGCTRHHLFRQLLAESLLLVTAGAVLGWLFAVWATRVLAVWSDINLNLAPDRGVLLFTLAISMLAALVFGLAPLRSASRVPIGLALKSASAQTTQDRGRLRSGQIVVALQMALCLALLVGAGLLVRTLRNLGNADLGMRAQGLLVFGVTPPQTARGADEIVRFYQSLTERFRALPAVESVTLMGNRIGSGWSNNTGASVDGKEPLGAGKFAPLRWNSVGPDYFHTLGINLVLGRDFNDADTATSPMVAVINRTFADRYLPNTQPLGHHIDRDKKRYYTIVGVVENSRYTGVREDPRPMAYFPYPQTGAVSQMHFELKGRGDPLALLPAVRRIVNDFGPDLPLIQPMTQQQQFEESFSNDRLFSRLAVFFGVLAALLVATGLYGTLAYRVTRRTAEIGVRMALGAQRGQVLWMILRESLVLCAIGIVVGLPLATALARLLKTMLFGLTPADPLSFAAALVGIALVALLASMVPARRASSVDPMVALRYE